jgi:RNA binding exosome subunit
MATSKAKAPVRKAATRAKTEATGLYGNSVALINKVIDRQRARAERGISEARQLGAVILEDISKRLGQASKKVDELAKKAR